MKALNILVVDEDKSQLPQFIDRLRRQGFTVRQISDWRVLAEVDDSLQPDVILLDLMMPHHDLPASGTLGGFATGSAVYRSYIEPCWSNIPFYVFTAALVDIPEISEALTYVRQCPAFRGVFTKDKEQAMLDELVNFAQK